MHLSYLSHSFNASNDISGKKIGFISYGSGSKSKVFEGTVQPNWSSKLEAVQLFEYLNKRSSIEVDTYEKIHCSKLDKPVIKDSKIAFNRIETDNTNYGLRRYIINDK